MPACACEPLCCLAPIRLLCSPTDCFPPPTGCFPLPRADLIPLPEEGDVPAEALAKVVAAFKEAHDAGEKCVVHCRAGVSRTGLAQAAWLVAQYGLSPEEAKAEVERSAKESGVKRAVKVAVPSADALGGKA